jgi:hypothetical protein
VDTAGKNAETLNAPIAADDPYMSAFAAASELGIAPKTVLSRIVAGELTGKSVAGRTVVTKESVARLKAKMQAEADEKEAEQPRRRRKIGTKR